MEEGKDCPEEASGQQTCPEGLEMRRQRSSSSLWERRPEDQPSRKRSNPGPTLQHFVRACISSARALFALWLYGELSPLKLSICKSREPLACLIISFLLICILRSSLLMKNNFLLKMPNGFRILKQQKWRAVAQAY